MTIRIPPSPDVLFEGMTGNTHFALPACVRQSRSAWAINPMSSHNSRLRAFCMTSVEPGWIASCLGVFGRGARDNHIPTRPREWRAAFPETAYGRETESFLKHYGKNLESAGIRMDAWAREQVEMRLGFARRMNRRLRAVKPELESRGIHWMPWMTRVTLYYYYPEKLRGDTPWIRQLGETLVACEQFEAHHNRQRGQDYYCREEETVHEALDYLETLRGNKTISAAVANVLVDLAAEGTFDQAIIQARGVPVTRQERIALQELATMRIH